MFGIETSTKPHYNFEWGQLFVKSLLLLLFLPYTNVCSWPHQKKLFTERAQQNSSTCYMRDMDALGKEKKIINSEPISIIGSNSAWFKFSSACLTIVSIGVSSAKPMDCFI